MTYVIPPGFSRFTVQHRTQSPLGSTPVWGIGFSGSPSPTILDDLIEAWEDNIQPVLNDEWSATRFEMRSDALVYDRVMDIAGARTPEAATPSTAALVSLTTGLPGRSNRGRIYLPGMLSADEISSDGQMFDTPRLQIGGAISGLIEAAQALDYEPVILHSNSSDPTPVLTWNVQQLVATQRRRLRR